MLAFAIVLTLYTQTSDNVVETKSVLFANNKVCLEQGAELVDLVLAGRSKDGKSIRSAWFNCQSVRGRAESVARTKAPGSGHP